MKDGLSPSKIDQLLARLKPHPAVALVDDDANTLDLLERTFKDEGYCIHRFQRAEDFLKKFSEIHPDVVVMETVLPGMSGLAALAEIQPKDLGEITPVLILTKKDDPRAKLLAFRRGASDYVTKPFDSGEVAARVRALLRARLLQEMIQMSAFSDPLTTLCNRKFLTDWLAREIERVKRYKLNLSCLLLDLDHFRHINERNGPRYGDFILSSFSQVIMDNTRKSDVIGRIENDEFAILLPGTSKNQAMVLARRLRDAVGNQKFELKGKNIKPTFCIGITGCRASEADAPEAVLGRAREALQKAKSVGEGETAALDLE